MSFLDVVADTAINTLIGDLAGNYALITSPTRFIGDLFPDVVVREIHTDEFVITAFPVETGTPISDHVFAAPKLIEIVFGYTDDGKFPGYTAAAYQAILGLANEREPFTVSTGKRAYQNMLIANVTTVTDEQFESAGIFTVRLQEVIITNTEQGSSSSLSGDKQANPKSTGPETQTGTQSLQSYSGLSGFSTSGPVASTGTSVGIGGNAGGGLSFGSYMSGFPA